jgi:hypothetical protein
MESELPDHFAPRLCFYCFRENAIGYFDYTHVSYTKPARAGICDSKHCNELHKIQLKNLCEKYWPTIYYDSPVYLERLRTYKSQC